MKRRSFVKGTLSAGATSLAVGAGLLSPATLFAEDAAKQEAAPAADAPAAEEAKASGFDMATIESATESADIKLKAPAVAENGAVVPVTIDATAIEGVTAISIVAPNNPEPLAASFDLGEGALGFAATRIKMGKSGSIVALVTVGDKAFKTQSDVKVTIGGCGG